MVLITDGGVGSSPLHAYMSSSPGNMSGFVAAAEPTLSPSELPPAPPSTPVGVGPASIYTSDDGALPLGPPKHPPHKGAWAMNQIAFVPDKVGAITMVSYALYTGTPVYVPRRQQYSMAYTHTIYKLLVQPSS
jgi:hypothetical protein